MLCYTEHCLEDSGKVCNKKLCLEDPVKVGYKEFCLEDPGKIVIRNFVYNAKKICTDRYYPILFKIKKIWKNRVRTTVPIANDSLWPYKIAARHNQVEDLPFFHKFKFCQKIC